jgi:4-amino-4-deoxy-L-arabinose transferase-like glycosyltransferase
MVSAAGLREPTRGEVAFFFAAALLLFTANLGGTSLAPLDDCFYARKAAEMAAHPGMTVTWGGRPAFQNSPGQLWLVAASLRVFGANDFAARLPAALMAFGVLALTAWIGARLRSPAAGLTAAALLAASPLFLNNARRVMLEIPLLFWMTLAMAAVVGWRRRPAAILLFGPALAMAMLTKSVLGLTPLLVAGVAAAEFKEWRVARDPRFWIAVALGLGLGASWWLQQWSAFDGEFARVHFSREIAGRSLESVGWWQRVLGYPAILLAQFEPVLVLAIPAAWWIGDSGRDGFGDASLLLPWAVLPVGIALFSSAQSAHYVFAIFPALALIAGIGLSERWPRVARVVALRVVPALLLVGAAVLWLRPELLTRDVNRPWRDGAGAPAVRAAAGGEVAFLGSDYWRQANPLLWYANLRLGASAPTAAEAIERARLGDRLLLVERARLAELLRLAPRATTVIDARDAVLLRLPDDAAN